MPAARGAGLDEARPDGLRQEAGAGTGVTGAVPGEGGARRSCAAVPRPAGARTITRWRGPSSTGRSEPEKRRRDRRPAARVVVLPR
ncbi:hypothetical protein EAO76_13445 [Streptomyces sp. sk2.1]|nr:hypothetical protein EAO76_13445 [Streptomyces sp. sk2.1]